MIRIRIQLILLSLLVGSINPLLAQSQIGARGVALSNATTALNEYNWSIFSNPALINSEVTELGFYGLRNYGFAEITDIAAKITHPILEGVAGLGAHRYGDHLFSETRIRAAYKYTWNRLHAGLAVNYNHLSFGGPYGSGGAIGMDLGIAAELSNSLWLGAVATNFNQPQYQFEDASEDLARALSVGLSYTLGEQALFVFDVLKDVRFPTSYRGGVELEIVENLVGRIGVSTDPNTYSFGLGYQTPSWQVNIATQQHPFLGISPGFDLIVRL